MTIKDMLNAGIQFCEGDGVIIRTFDEKRNVVFDLAFTDCLKNGLSSLSNGELYVNARIIAIYLEDGKMVFFIEDPENE